LFGFSVAQSPSIGMIEEKFCNNWIISNELDLVGKAWEEISICVQLKNLSNIDMDINIDFLDSVVTSDAFKNRACNAADRPKVNFGNFMMDYEKTIKIKWWETIQKEVKIKFPVGFQWLSHGCVAYNVIGESNKIEWNNMFNIIVRNVKFVDILITKAEIKSDFQLLFGPKIQKNNNWKYVINFALKNKWNVSQLVNISWDLSNFFGYKKHLLVSNLSIKPGRDSDIFTDEFDLPSYKWFLKIKSIISYMPELDFNITNSNISENTLSWWEILINKIVFVFSWTFVWLIGVIIVILILIYLSLFRRRRKIVTVDPQSGTI